MSSNYSIAPTIRPTSSPICNSTKYNCIGVDTSSSDGGGAATSSSDGGGEGIIAFVVLFIVFCGPIVAFLIYVVMGCKVKEELIRHKPLIHRWYTYSKDKHQNFTDEAYDCCWICTYNVSLWVIRIIVGLFAVMADVVISLLIIVYDISFGVWYSIIRCVSCGKCAILRHYFIYVPEGYCNCDDSDSAKHDQSQENGQTETIKIEGTKTDQETI